MLLLSPADFFFKIDFLQNNTLYYMNTIRVANGLDPHQDQRSVVLSVLIWFQTVCKG